MMCTNLVLRRASVSRISDSWSEDDYGVLDGERVVGRIYLATDASRPHFSEIEDRSQDTGICGRGS